MTIFEKGDESEGMADFIHHHNRWLEGKASSGEEWKNWRAIHCERLADLRHERAIHLGVTLGFALLTFIALGIWLMVGSGVVAVLFFLLLLLLIFYIRHYWLLENSSQRWMRLIARLDRE